MSTISVKNKRILLVGATGILGKRYSKTLLDEGAKLILADRKETDITEFSNSLGVRSVTFDISDEGQVIAAIKEAAEIYGGFDGVVNNAAITGDVLQEMGDAFAPFEDYPTSLFRKTVDVNLIGSFLVARESGRIMKKAGNGGSVVNVSSIYGIVAPDHRIYEGQKFRSFVPYSASKAGIIGLTKWLATWWGKDQIRVNCLVPGGVYNNHNKAFTDAYSNRVPLGRMALPEDMEGMLIYLLSDASSYCTGGVFAVDGGLSAW